MPLVTAPFIILKTSVCEFPTSLFLSLFLRVHKQPLLSSGNERKEKYSAPSCLPVPHDIYPYLLTGAKSSCQKQNRSIFYSKKKKWKVDASTDA